ncbi:hypothetical protein [Paraburkholderia sp. HP33-1]|uniref:hypothetical protein n=1 Tax=Paraburkholderia sp. HP33-1 TaxID=2883243 RepID=UPI001F29A8F1|nr:hypothetical protein [Paraburkholderia sp. HP33-1]
MRAIESHACNRHFVLISVSNSTISPLCSLEVFIGLSSPSGYDRSSFSVRAGAAGQCFARAFFHLNNHTGHVEQKNRQGDARR